jgi:hypothetical protein
VRARRHARLADAKDGGAAARHHDAAEPALREVVAQLAQLGVEREGRRLQIVEVRRVVDGCEEAIEHATWLIAGQLVARRQAELAEDVGCRAAVRRLD